MDEKAEPSVWYIASLAICVFVGVMLVAGILGGTDASAVTVAAK